MARRLDEKSRIAVCGYVDSAPGLEDLCVCMEGALVWTGKRAWTGKEHMKKLSQCT